MMQIKLKVATFLIGVHYFAHNTNLTMINLSTLDLMHWMGVILQSFYTFLVQKLKKYQIFLKLIDFLNTKGKKVNSMYFHAISNKMGICKILPFHDEDAC
jgi:hypothetical protein